MDETDEILQEFLSEGRDGLDQLDRDLVELEGAPGNREVLARVFRCVHTIKGTCGFLGLSKLESVTHAGENLLSRLRDGELSLTPELATLLLSVVDAIRAMMAAVETSGSDGDAEYTELVASLQRAVAGKPAEPAPVAAAEPPVKPKQKKPRRRGEEKSQPATAAPVASPEPAPAPAAPPPPAPATPAAVALQPAQPAQVAAPVKANAHETVRIDVTLLDRLMDLAGELVLTRNQVLQTQRTLDDASLNAAAQRLNLVTAALQEEIMLMRMQPIDTLFSKLPRMVRDIAAQCKKRVQIEISANDTELDRTLLEAVKDPLLHLLRNAIDHGIELPEQRLAAGKAQDGMVSVKAVHQSSQVLIEISDDGSGIPVERVREKAIAAGLLSRERAAAMTRSELTQLIFLPGLSTAQAVTNVSGRGVGMDVVKTNVERLGGTIEVETESGRGTVFRLRLPLTLAIVPAFIVESSQRRYALPQVNLDEFVLVDGKKQRIELVHGAPVLRLRGKLLPLLHLSEVLGCETAEQCQAKSKAHVAVLQTAGHQFGLVVDRVIDQQEIVVKPLAAQLASTDVYAGCTILGDGAVVLILDGVGIAERAGLARRPAKEHEDTRRARSAAQTEDEPSSWLLMRGEQGKRFALPLGGVTRLEIVRRDRIEVVRQGEVVQHGSEIMPLVRLAKTLGDFSPEADPNSEFLNVVVVPNGDGHVGVIVHDVEDVVDLAELPKQQPSDTAGISGVVVVQEHVTELLDLGWLLQNSGIPLQAGAA